MIVAYRRRHAWQGMWQLLAKDQAVVHNCIAIYLEQHDEAEAAVFDIPSIEPPARFADGEAPGKLLYQITSQYRRFLKEMAHGS